jgi:UDP-2,4-diacetamido-2,4,6-trideoxy-beta-L-altropyranose hydrolase
MNKLIVLTAGNSTIGLGHVVRCQALVSQLKYTNAIFYSVDDLNEMFEDKLYQNLKFERLNNIEDILSQLNEQAIIIIDDYQISNPLVAAIRSKSAGIVFIDDLAERYFYADLVINPTPGFDVSKYIGLMETQYLVGMEYALLRQPFLELAKQARKTANKNLMICFGGSDPKNLTETALQTAIDSDFFDEIHVVIGSGHQHFNRIKETYNAEKIHFYENLIAENMATLMSENTYAIYPCSGILLEGLAAKQRIVSGYYIDNQKYVYALHKEIGSFFDAKSFEKNDIELAFENMMGDENSEPPNYWIDGKSIERIQKNIDIIFQAQNFNIRRANEDDVDFTFSWANDPETRKFSFSKDKIEWHSHCNWFRKKIISKNCIYLILEKDSSPIGSIRFDINDGDALISYLIAPENHGQGYGTVLLKKGLHYLENLQDDKNLKSVTGIVQEANVASIKTFERFAFRGVKEKGNFVFSKYFVKDENWKS